MKKYIIILIASLMAARPQVAFTLERTTSIVQVDTEESVEESSFISPQLEREFYQKAYQLLIEYAQSASVSDETEEFNFRRIFASDDMQICNDLMSLSREATLSIDKYIELLQGAKRVKTTVRNIKKEGSIQKDETEDAWVLYISFEKGISYSKCGTLFNSTDYFGDYYHLKAKLLMNMNTGQCKIGSLVANEDFQALVFPEEFTVLERTHEDENMRNYKRDDKLTINGRDVSGMWNLYGQVMLHSGDKIKYNNAIVDEEVVAEDKCGGRKIHANYNDKSFRIRANFGYSLFGFNKLNNEDAKIKHKDNEMSFGLDVGYVLPSTSKFYVGFFAGIGMSKNKLTLEMESGNDGHITQDISRCTADEDGDTYTRHYDVKGGLSQQFASSEIVIPVYADLEYNFIPQLSGYIDLGMRLQTTSDTWTANIGEYTTSGTYNGTDNNSSYGELLIDGSVNLNGFGIHAARSLDVDKEGMSSRVSINAIAGLGLRANISKSFAFDAGVQYYILGGKSWNIDHKSNSIFSYSLPEGYENMNASEKAQGDKVNLLRLSNGIKHNALRLTVSLIYKF